MPKSVLRSCSCLIPAGVAILLLALAGAGQASVIAWNPDTRTLAFSGPEGKTWLVEGVAQIKLTGGPVISTRDKRFKVAVAEHHDRWVLTGADTEKTLDWEMVITSVDHSSVRMDLTVFNHSALSQGLRPA